MRITVCLKTMAASGALAATAAVLAGPPMDSAPPPATAATPDTPATTATQPKKATTGSLAVRAVQGTKDGPAVRDAPIEVRLFQNGQLMQTMEAQLDEHGVVIVEGFPIGTGVTPVVRIKHADVMYQDVGPELTPDSPENTMDLTVYETTDTEPQWHVLMRHVLVEPHETGVLVSDMVIVENPSDRTWLGGPADESGQRTAFRTSLPVGAHDVQLLEGFHGWCCTTVKGGTLAVQMPLMPGKARYRFAYEVPVSNGAADLNVKSPVPMDQMALFVPDDGTGVQASGLESQGVSNMGQMQVRFYRGADIAPGTPAGIVLTGLKAAAPEVASSPATGSAKIVAGVGIGLALLGGVAVLAFRKPAKGATNATSRQEPAA